MIVEREVPVRVRIAPARCDVSWVEHVGIDQLHFSSDAFKPLCVTLLHVLAPKFEALKELDTVGYLAAEFIGVLLEHVL
jgi:hypothetical protein